MMGVTGFEKDDGIKKKIDELVDKIYREKFWKADGGDKWPGALDKLGKIHRVKLKDPMTGEELKLLPLLKLSTWHNCNEKKRNRIRCALDDVGSNHV